MFVFGRRVRCPAPDAHWEVRELTGFLALLMSLAVAPRTMTAQAVPNRDDAVELRKQFVAELDSLNSKFTALANAFPADKYSWRPAPGVRSVGEAFMHVASEFYVYAPMVVGATPSPVIPQNQKAMENFEKSSTKADVLKHLADGLAYATTAVNGVEPDSLVGHLKLAGGKFTVIQTTAFTTDDLHEHLGQLIAYARMNGITPPWSKKM